MKQYIIAGVQIWSEEGSCSTQRKIEREQENMCPKKNVLIAEK